MKTIYQSSTINELCSTHPELIDVLVQIGFRDLANPIMRSSVGKFMTLPKGAKAKGFSWEVIVETLYQHGFTVIE